MTNSTATDNNFFATGDDFLGMNIYENEDGERYACALTEAQANEASKQEIRELLWAFNAEFIAEHCDLSELNSYEIHDFIECLKDMQSRMCESCNSLVYQLISAGSKFDVFAEKAIESDGRGHFLSGYNSEELESSEMDDSLISAVLENEKIDPTDLVAVNRILAYRLD